MEDSSRYHGSIVALEGVSDAVSTQLRLLPTSSQILILPSIQHYLKSVEKTEAFNAKQLIRQIHSAALRRHEAALEFLRQSTPRRKRFVFLNGGTIGAQALCIATICKNQTNGDISQADLIFGGIVRGGVPALLKDITTWRKSIPPGGKGASNKSPVPLRSPERAPDPITQAMRAAEALDRETESLQPPSHDLDLTIPAKHARSASLPVLDFTDQFQDTTPFFVFGAPSDGSLSLGGSTAPTSLLTSPVKSVEMLASVGKHPKRISIVASPCTSHAGELCDVSTYPLFSPLSDVHTSPPQSPERVVFGEAQVVQMGSPGAGEPLRRVKSVDRLFLGSEHATDAENPSSLELDPQRLSMQSTAKRWSRLRQQSTSCVATAAPQPQRQPETFYLDVPKAVFVRANTTTIVHSPTQCRTKSNMRYSYVDKGVDAPEFLDLDDSDTEETADAPFEPVLPLVEDLVVHLSDESPNEILEFVIQGFKERSYPVFPETDSSTSETNSGPETPSSKRSLSASDKHRVSLGAVQHFPPAVVDTDEYDPYASHGSYGLTSFPYKDPTDSLAATSNVEITTEPAPANQVSDRRFFTLPTTGHQTAVLMQNSLRSVLNARFPIGDIGYNQSHFPLLPELDSLWKPVFRQSEHHRHEKDDRIDLILAIGAQKGVKKEYSAAITGQIEKLGTKPSGISRSGRLDLRYLIATAMQAFTAQPLTSQAQDNPLINHTLLATLIIPHLEIYLAAHMDTRFLILEYPAEHLSTVLALQKLIGSDAVKVAGILDGEDSEPIIPDHFRLRGSARAETPLDEGLDSISLDTALPKASSSTPVSFSKANFLLTSTATDSEIATFISTIWKMLIAASEFYVPAHPPRKVASQASLHRPAHTKDSAATSAIETTYYFPRESMFASGRGAISPPRTPPGAIPAVPPMPPMPPRPPSPAESARSGNSVAGSMKSGKTWRTAFSIKGGRIRSLRSRPGRADKESLYAWVDSEGEDEDYDLEVKRLMPMFVRRRDMQVEKGNSQKALKWLGLA